MLCGMGVRGNRFVTKSVLGAFAVVRETALAGALRGFGAIRLWRVLVRNDRTNGAVSSAASDARIIMGSDEAALMRLDPRTTAERHRA
jgi:hypothetical protein